MHALKLDARTQPQGIHTTTDVTVSPQWLEDEKSHRLFWAAWVQGAINSDHYVTGSSPNSRAFDVALPVSEDAFRLSREEPFTTLGERLGKSRTGTNSWEARETSVAGEAVVAIHFW